jgi:hypothetical protein
MDAPGVTAAGEKEQVAPVGRPAEHDRETGFENAPFEVDETATENTVGTPA